MPHNFYIYVVFLQNIQIDPAITFVNKNWEKCTEKYYLTLEIRWEKKNILAGLFTFKHL